MRKDDTGLEWVNCNECKNRGKGLLVRCRDYENTHELICGFFEIK